MNNSPASPELRQILRDLADELDVSPSKYEEAQNRYNAVGEWLNQDPALLQRGVEIFPQGSFALGTVIKPLSDQEYDVDAVCKVNFTEMEITQKQLKHLIGERLKSHKTYHKMLNPEDGHRRCWRLTYADGSQFHLDICPAIPDQSAQFTAGIPLEQTRLAISITDKQTWDKLGEWPKSNPGGYVLWFKNRMRTILNERLEKRAQEKRAKVEEIKDYEVRTPLQRLIQLLKRHRDMKYGNDEDRPISIIITTLAAKAYQNEPDIATALFSIIPAMRGGIEKRVDGWWVPNPVNPKENFADKWAETPRKANLFFEWLGAVEKEHKALLTPNGFEKVAEYLTEAYGAREASGAMFKYASRNQGKLVKHGSSQAPLNESIAELTSFNLPQRQRPTWPIMQPQANQVNITTKWRKSGNWNTIKDGYIVRGSELLFQASTDTPPPFNVYWQVVNTGKEARAQDNLRGDIFSDREPTSLNHIETAKYRGRHWIECFIVKGDRCVARSGETVVNIV